MSAWRPSWQAVALGVILCSLVSCGDEPPPTVRLPTPVRAGETSAAPQPAIQLAPTATEVPGGAQATVTLVATWTRTATPTQTLVPAATPTPTRTLVPVVTPTPTFTARPKWLPPPTLRPPARPGAATTATPPLPGP